jgi:hypothetical protein
MNLHSVPTRPVRATTSKRMRTSSRVSPFLEAQKQECASDGRRVIEQEILNKAMDLGQSFLAEIGSLSDSD